MYLMMNMKNKLYSISYIYSLLNQNNIHQDVYQYIYLYHHLLFYIFQLRKCHSSLYLL